MNALAKISLKNRALIALISVCAIIFGTIAATSLKQELFPEVSFPQAMVTTEYTGASPEAVEREVTQPIESALGAVESIESISSVSSTGMSQITVETEYGTNSDDVVRELQRAVSQVEAQLPEGVTPNVMSGSIADFPVFISSVTSDKSQAELAGSLEDVVIPELTKIEGVRDVQMAGQATQHVEIRIDEDKLEDEGVSLEEVAGLLQANGIPTSTGELSTGGASTPVEVGEKLESVDSIAQLQLNGEDGPVALDDIAEVKLANDPTTSISRTNGVESLTLQVTKKPDANTVEVAQAVDAKLQELKSQLGDNTEFVTAFDQAPYITQSIDDLLHEGMLGLIFAVVVILVFLLSIRATLITAISIPLSLLITLIAVWQSGYSLNMLTLAALTMSIGRVVDDSIVVIESIRRRQSLGGTKFANILAAVKEVAGAITASTLTTVAVFLPLAFVGGQMGELFRPFALTSSIALLSSLLVSLTIVPVLAYWFLRTRESRVKLTKADKADIKKSRKEGLQQWKAERKAAKKARSAVAKQDGKKFVSPAGGPVSTDGGQHSTTETAFVSTYLSPQDAKAEEVDELATLRSPHTRLQKTYTPFVGWATRHPAITLLIAVIVLIGTVAMVPQLKMSNFGEEGSDSIQASHEFEPGISLDQASQRAEQVEEILANQAGVDSYQLFLDSGSGAMGPSSGSGTISGNYMINLSDGADYAQVASELSDKFAQLDKDAGTVEVLSNQGSVSSETVDITLTSNDIKALETAAGDLTTKLEESADIESVSNDLEAIAPMVTVKVDKKEAAERGLTEQGVGEIVQRAMNGQNIGSIIIDATTHDVLLYNGNVDSLEKLRELDIPYQSQSTQAAPMPGMPPTTTTEERTVELQDIAKVEETKTAPTIKRSDGLRSVTVSATPKNDDLRAVGVAVDQVMSETDLPDGVTTEESGATAELADSQRQLVLAMLAAILIVFVILVATFKSLLQPLILLVSIPFAATGSIGLLLATNLALSQTAMIGMLMLIGIVVTNAIVLIDLINHYRAHGVDLRTAVYHGARQRFRPIIMTAAATIFAMLPMALGLTGGGMFVSRDLAVVVIGGLLSSTLLTLLLVPALYQLLEGWKERRAEKKAVKLMARNTVIDRAEARPAQTDTPAAEASPPEATATSAEQDKPQAH